MGLSDDATDDSRDSNGLPCEVARVLSSSDRRAFNAAVEGALIEKLAALVQTPAKQITLQTKLVDIGTTSMLAVEARQQVTLGVDVPLMKIVEPKTKVKETEKHVADGLARYKNSL